MNFQPSFVQVYSMQENMELMDSDAYGVSQDKQVYLVKQCHGLNQHEYMFILTQGNKLLCKAMLEPANNVPEYGYGDIPVFFKVSEECDAVYSFLMTLGFRVLPLAFDTSAIYVMDTDGHVCGKVYQSDMPELYEVLS